MYLKLCYLENNIMYFTSDIDNQWGDDWDSRPYKCNAVPHTMPCSFYINSPYSAQDINNRIIPWEYTDEAGGALWW